MSTKNPEIGDVTILSPDNIWMVVAVDGKQLRWMRLFNKSAGGGDLTGTADISGYGYEVAFNLRTDVDWEKIAGALK